MNIIQIQDRLKGLPDEVLISYVEKPTGAIPIYLILGELGSRKEMRERYEADKQPLPSITEQIIAEAKPQPMEMGLGSMNPQAMMPTSEEMMLTQQPEEMTPQQLASSGVGSLPVSNVGDPVMMSKGGIIGGYAQGGTAKQEQDKFLKLLGVDPTTAIYEKEIDRQRQDTENLEKNKLNDFLINFGLETARQQSPNFLSNVAQGGTKAVEQQGERIESINKINKDIYGLNIASAQAQRAAQLAATNFGLESEAAQRALANARNIEALQSKNKIILGELKFEQEKEDRRKKLIGDFYTEKLKIANDKTLPGNKVEIDEKAILKQSIEAVDKIYNSESNLNKRARYQDADGKEIYKKSDGKFYYSN